MITNKRVYTYRTCSVSKLSKARGSSDDVPNTNVRSTGFFEISWIYNETP